MSSLTNLRHGVEFLALRLVIAIVRSLPLDRAVPISAATWRWLAPKSKRRHQRALNNLAKAFPEKSETEREEIALAAWANLGRVMVETMQLDRILEQSERIEILHSEVLARYKGKIGPLICCSLHTGNWELATMPLVAINAQPAAIYRLVSNPYVDAYLRQKRKALYPGGMFSRGAGGINKAAGFNTARHIGSYLRRGGRIGMMADLYDKRGVDVPFFSHNATSQVFPALLARRLGCRLWVGRCIRVGEKSQFKVEMKELKISYTDDKQDDIKQITAALQRQFEEWIREYPEQWMWSNRKWS